MKWARGIKSVIGKVNIFIIGKVDATFINLSSNRL